MAFHSTERFFREICLLCVNTSDLGLSVLCASFILIVNNFLYGQYLTKIF